MRLSVVIPVYNGAAFLERCLQSLAASEFRDYECIVVDDGSTDASVAVAARHGATIMRLEQRGGPARARNRGVARAGGECVVFLDADVCVHPDTLGRIAAHLCAHPDVDAVMGSYDDVPADPGLVSQYKNLFHHYVHHQNRGEAWSFWAGCGAVRRGVFLESGGFDETYARPSIEDIELGFRLRARGHRIELDPTIQVTHLKRWTLGALLRTDFLDRAVPWLLLMLRHRTMPAHLNLARTHRLSVALVFAILIVSGLALAKQLMPPGNHWAALLPPLLLALAVSGGAVVLLLLLNADLYRFFARKRGMGFAAAAVLLHWWYYTYCGVAVVVGLGVHMWRGALRSPASLARAPGHSSSPP